MKKGKTPEKVNSTSWGAFFRMVRQIDLPWLLILSTFIVNMLYSQFMVLLPATSGALFSGSLEPAALQGALQYYLSYIPMAFLYFSFGSFCQNWATRNARNKVWGEMTRIRADYYDSHTPTALTSAVTNDLPEAVVGIIRLITNGIPSLYYIFAALFIIQDFDKLLLLPLVILLPVKYIYMVKVSRWFYKAQVGIYHRIGVLTGYLGERAKNLSLIKHFGTEAEELENGKNATQNLFRAKFHNVKVNCADTGVSTAISLLQDLANIIFSVILLQQGRIDVGAWVAFFLYSRTIDGKFNELIYYWQLAKKTQGQAARVVDIVEAPKEQSEQEAKAAFSVNADSTHAPVVEFKHVSFAYGEKQALKDVSFTVPAGTATAIVGLTGSGKTTMLNLLERFYETGTGSVTLDGQDVKDMSLGQLRGRYSYVQQDAGVFSGTVRDALTYGINRTISDDELVTAAKNAGAWDFVEKMPGQLDAVIAADGGSLSGGQRQRLVLAREFLRNADVLLLDEPTSALDAQTAQAVEKTIFDLFRDKTILMVTHDMSLVSGMDQIVVLENGKCMGQGTYDQLMATCPLFQEMVHAQR